SVGLAGGPKLTYRTPSALAPVKIDGRSASLSGGPAMYPCPSIVPSPRRVWESVSLWNRVSLPTLGPHPKLTVAVFTTTIPRTAAAPAVSARRGTWANQEVAKTAK